MNYYYGYVTGVSKGIDKYHQMCYNIGGWVIDSAGHVVRCDPSGQLPKDEIKKLNPTS